MGGEQRGIIMSAMSDSSVLTRDDLDALPDNGLRHELVDGAIIMTPAPGTAHQTMTLRLWSRLDAACAGTGLKALAAPFDVVLGEDVFQPDIVVAAREAFSARDLAAPPQPPPLLVVEVRAPATAHMDIGIKRDIYEAAGIPSYWLLDPSEPSATMVGLVEGRYEQVGRVTGDDILVVTQPLAVEFSPAGLLRD